MKKFVLGLFLWCLTTAQSQSLDDLSNAYASGQFETVLIKGSALEKEQPNNIELKLLLGRAYADAAMPDKAIPYLLYVSDHDPDKSWRKAWAMAYLGSANFQKANNKQALAYLQQAIDLNATETVTRYAKRRLALFGFSEAYRDFVTRETPHIIFHIAPAAAEKMGNIDEFAQQREESFAKINQFFHGMVPKKIDFFVWPSGDELRAATGSPGGFSAPEYSICHTVYNQTPGHELIHVISHYTAPAIRKSVLINEGTAVYFDQTARNRLAQAQEAVQSTGQPIKVKDAWNTRGLDEKVLYPVAGAFIEHLLLKEGKEKFLLFFKDQSYSNAQKVYGERLEALVADFEKSVNEVLEISAPAPSTPTTKISVADIDAVIEKNDPSSKYYRVLVLINDKAVSVKEMEKTDPTRIRDLKVLKKKEEIRNYLGVDMDLNGIIIISTQ